MNYPGVVIRFLFAAVALVLTAAAQERAVDLARRLREAGLDPEQCYRVRDLSLAREDAKIFLTDGYLIFGKPVGGRPIAAVFTTEVDGGDGEVLVLPPNRSERMSLAAYTKSPNLNEHIRTAVMLFTDATAKELAESVRDAKKSREMGNLLAERWNPVVSNFASSFEVRLVNDLLSVSAAGAGLFYAALSGSRLGNFDVVYDPRVPEQVVVGQVAFRDNRSYFDTWTAFEARSFRNGARTVPGPPFTINDVRIEVTVEPNLHLAAVTRITLTPSVSGERVLGFEISRKMRIQSATVNGETAEVFQRESLRAGLIRGNDNDVFLVIAPKELARGRACSVEFKHEGDLVLQAGPGVYYVGARGTWYPRRGLEFSRYDLTFRYPTDLSLVANGDIVEDRTEGETRVTRRRVAAPIRLAGFNLGKYVKASASRGGQTVEVYGNRKLEAALQPKPREVVVMPPGGPLNRTGPRRGEILTLPVEQRPPNPNARLQELATEVAGSLEFMAGFLGPPPLKTLTVSPIPGTFGQGFPGLVYLSTLAYLDPKERPPELRSESQRVFFSEILHAHEVAHQWWGNVVTAAGYEDEWLMEALANYSALMYLEKRKGARVVESVLDEYRAHLLHKTESGATLESTGPIVWGLRLESSLAPAAWRTIVYEKGTWIIHMLRRRLGDERFLAMLGALRRKYEYRAITTEQFRQLAASSLPASSPDAKLEGFFDAWVYGTGIPALKLSQTQRGAPPAVRVSGTLAQSDVEEDFTVWVPVEIQAGRAKPQVQWLRTGSEPSPFQATAKQRPVKVSLAPGYAVLTRN